MRDKVPKLHLRLSEVPFPRVSAGSKAPEVEGAAFWGAEVLELAEIYRSVKTPMMMIHIFHS